MIAEPLSPELALVDPELAERARRALPDPVVEEAPAPSAAPAPRVTATILRKLGTGALVASLFLNVVLLREKIDPGVTAQPASPAVAVVAGTETQIPPVSKPAKAASRPAPPPQQRPKARSRPKLSRRTLSWRASGRAVGYDVILWRGHRRIADVWTTKPRLSVDALRCGRRLAAGRYLWFVYPVRSRAEPRRYGRLLRWGVLEVSAARRC